MLNSITAILFMDELPDGIDVDEVLK